MATTLAIIQYKNTSYQARFWVCDGCFKLRFLNDKSFADQLLQVKFIEGRIMIIIRMTWIDNMITKK